MFGSWNSKAVRAVVRALGSAVCGLAFLAATGCGAPAEDQQEPTTTSHAALCAGAARQNGDGTVTKIACAFEQQTFNMMTYGEAVSPETLYDASGQRLATLTQSCDTWWLGTDEDGTWVIINSETGAVTSHGMVHPGQATSRLPATVVLPLSVEPAE